jgi:hypothetical protein
MLPLRETCFAYEAIHAHQNDADEADLPDTLATITLCPTTGTIRNRVSIVING